MQELKNGSPLQQAQFVYQLASEHYHVFSASLREHQEQTGRPYWRLEIGLKEDIQAIKGRIEALEKEKKDEMNDIGWIYITDMLRATVIVNDTQEVWKAYSWLKRWSHCKGVLSLDDQLHDANY